MSNGKKFAIIEVHESQIDNNVLRELGKTIKIGSETGTGCEKSERGYVCGDEDAVA